jgi:lipoyl(octanoyl) transferase
MSVANVVSLGLIDYREAWAIQLQVAEAVLAGRLPDTVLFVEHPPTVTLGRRTEAGEVHVPAEAEVDLVETDRGGRSTYHAPGQLVCYPILDLRRHGKDVRLYCRTLEQAIIETLAPYAIAGVRIEGLTGVWVGTPGADARKIASIGVHISRWVTTHGYALNVDLDPAPFSEWITACGLEQASFTSMALELGAPTSTDEVAAVAAEALARVFDLELEAPEGRDEPWTGGRNDRHEPSPARTADARI